MIDNISVVLLIVAKWFSFRFSSIINQQWKERTRVQKTPNTHIRIHSSLCLSLLLPPLLSRLAIAPSALAAAAAVEGAVVLTAATTTTTSMPPLDFCLPTQSCADDNTQSLLVEAHTILQFFLIRWRALECRSNRRTTTTEAATLYWTQRRRQSNSCASGGSAQTSGSLKATLAHRPANWLLRRHRWRQKRQLLPQHPKRLQNVD